MLTSFRHPNPTGSLIPPPALRSSWLFTSLAFLMAASALTGAACECTPSPEVSTPSAKDDTESSRSLAQGRLDREPDRAALSDVFDLRVSDRRVSDRQVFDLHPTGTGSETHQAHKRSKKVVEKLTYQQIVDPRRKAPGSVSFQTVGAGGLIRAKRLPLVGRHYRVCKICWNRRTNFGTDELIELMTHAAGEVASRFPRSKLMIGNLSRKKGGRIRWSRSHQAGRDADLMFYVRLRGHRVVSPGFVRFGNGLLRSMTRRYEFDTERNWALVKALITHPTVQVQWIFIADHLRHALLDWGLEHGEPMSLLRKAAVILRQPSDSTPHDDHAHVRIYCSRQDRLEGCLNTGPYWQGVETHRAAVAARVQTLLEGLGDNDSKVRVRVIGFLQRLHAPEVAPRIAQTGLVDPSPEVRHAALDALIRWQSHDPRVVDSLLRLVLRPGTGFRVTDPVFEKTTLASLLSSAPPPDEEKDPQKTKKSAKTREVFDAHRTPHQIRRAYVALSEIESPRIIAFFRAGLTSKRMVGRSRRYRASLPEPLLAAWAAKSQAPTELVGDLIRTLGHPRPDVRQAAAETLRKTTNHSLGVKWARAMGATVLRKHASRWRKWWSIHSHLSRRQLVVDGFRQVRPRLRRYADLEDPWALRNLIALTRYPTFRGDNAHELLRELTGVRAKDRLPAERHRWWVHWWRSAYPHLVKERRAAGPLARKESTKKR